LASTASRDGKISAWLIRHHPSTVGKTMSETLPKTDSLKATHALVILLHEHESELGFEDNQVLLFTSQEAAQKWAVDRITEKCSQWKRDGSRIVYGVPVEVDDYKTDEEALDAYQCGLESMEYFHVVEIG
jgi:hypothetical protein